jgi:23S rRNA pseudouridine1911/1915/1917 synthase
MVSRGTIQRLITQGEIRVNGQVVKPSHHPRVGEQIAVHWPAPKADTAQPESIPMNILFEDELLLVLNKPAGLVVHPAAGHAEHTLVNALLHHCGPQLSGIGGVARPGIVHRLDKATSGCLVVAKTDAAHLSLAKQFERRQVEKQYHALVCGVVPHRTGEIRAAIGRHPTHRKRMSVLNGQGRAAWTSYQLLQQYPAAALVAATLHTGRTHQIRVHFQHLGFPLVGDMTYGKRPNERLTDTTGYVAPRQMLHAFQLAFLHPRTRQKLMLQAPWPEDFQAALTALS